MTLKSDAKFEEKLTLGSKNDMRNLVNFNASSGKSENLHFDVLLLSIAYKVSAKKVKNYLSWHWRVIQTLKKNWLFGSKNDLRNMVNFNAGSGKSENLHFNGLLFYKVYNVWAKKIQKSCVLKNDLKNLVNFYTSSFESNVLEK